MNAEKKADSVPDPSLPPLRFERAARAEAAVRSAGTWSLHHLNRPWLIVGALAVPAVVLAALLSGISGAIAVIVGCVVVGGFFSISAWAVARAGEIDPRYTMPVALTTYAMKLVLLGLLFFVYPAEDVEIRRWLGGSVAVGVLVWIVTHAVMVWRTPLLYVDVSAASDDAVRRSAVARRPEPRGWMP